MTTTVVAATLFGAPMSASAKDGDVVSRGDCTIRSDWKLKLSPENGRIEVEFEVDQNVNRQVWDVVLKKDGVVFWRGQRTTKAPSGSFEVRKLTGDGPGVETIVARAKNQKTGEVCRGVAEFTA
jgi:hypothetical protein